jgi:hypothetical protein
MKKINTMFKCIITLFHQYIVVEEAFHIKYLLDLFHYLQVLTSMEFDPNNLFDHV